MKKKILAGVLACILLIGIGVGGTLAWLTAQTNDVVNTFTSSDIDITLEESTTEYQMIPGHSIAKDPLVTVVDGSEDCWLFVKIEKSANYDTYLEEYAVAEGWTELDGEDGVYYRYVLATDATKSFYVLAGNEEIDGMENGRVVVKTSVEKDDMQAIDGVNADGNADQAELDARPTLTFTAYAVQYYQSNGDPFAVADAWANRSTT